MGVRGSRDVLSCRGVRVEAQHRASVLLVIVLFLAALALLLAVANPQGSAADTTGHITGTVKNAASAALPNISVTAYRFSGSNWDYATSVSTTAAGTYDIGGLTTGTYRIQFYDNAGAYVQQWYLNKVDLEHATNIAVTTGATNSGKNATLVKAGHITGTVKNAASTALQGISVYAYRFNGSSWDSVRSASTTAAGTYDLGGLPTGTYRIQFYDGAGAYVQQWYLNQPDRQHAVDVAVTTGATSSGKNATLVKAGHITGTVKNAASTALQGISVTAYRHAGPGIWSSAAYVTTTAAGTYNLGGLTTGTYRIQFYDGAGAYVQQWYLNQPDRQHAANIAVTTGATSSGKNATLVKAGHITGAVKNAASATLQGISVYAYRYAGSGEWDDTADTTTGAAGTYDLGGLPAGTYRIQFYDGAGAYVQQWYLNKADREHATDIAVTTGATSSGKNATLVKAGHITGTVKNAASAALQGISVYANRYDGSGEWDDMAYATTGAAGTYDLGGLPAGTYRIQFYDGSGAYVQQWYVNQPDQDFATNVAVATGATSSGKDATLAKAGHITGTVRNTGGGALGNISVRAYRYDGPGVWSSVASATTTPTGAYDLGGLTTGTYRIQFWDNAGAYVQQWYLNKVDLEHATNIAVTVGAITAGKNVSLVAQ